MNYAPYLKNIELYLYGLYTLVEMIYVILNVEKIPSLNDDFVYIKYRELTPTMINRMLKKRHLED